jgi:hypothetical protein
LLKWLPGFDEMRGMNPADLIRVLEFEQ